jgi:CHAT domain-containing protein
LEVLAASPGDTLAFVESRESAGNPAWFAIAGALHWGGEWEKVSDAYRTAAEGFEARGSPNDARVARIGSSTALRMMHRFRESQAEAERAVKLATEVGDPTYLVEAVTKVLEAVEKTGDRAGAFDLLATADPVHARAEPEVRRAYLLRAGNLLYGLARPEAWRKYEQLRQEAVNASDRDDEINALYGQLGILEQRASDNPSAANAARLREWASMLMEEVDMSSPAAAWPIAFLIRLEDAPAAADELLEVCLRVAQEEWARSYCLSARVRVAARLGDATAIEFAQRAVESARDHPDAVLIAWNEAMRASWVGGRTQETISRSFAALSRIEAIRKLQADSGLRAGHFSNWSDDYLWLSGKILDTAPDLLPTAFQVTERMRARSLLDQLSTSSATPDDFATLDEVRASLAPDQALLSYQIAPWVDWAGDFGGGSWLLAITRDGVRVHRLERDRTFWRRVVRTFVGLTAGRDGREEESAVELYRNLLGPALAELPAGIRRLVLVPDDVLHKLPFELLRERVGAPPLGERFEVSRVPSATLWRRWQEAPAETPDVPGWILADPSPLPPGPGGQPLRALPFARQEGREIAQALGGGSRLELGDLAGEAAFTGQPPRLAAVLHFGTHAVVDEDDAARSAIFLGAGAGGDGRLEPDEIVQLPVAGRLVVLSSCESAAGLLLRGEGVLSLARAFFQGRRTRAVVASLWPLRDDDARAFFSRFYRHLGRGETVAAAGRAVRAELRAAGFPAEAWAGVVVLGDGELAPIVRPAAEPGARFAGLAAAFGLGAALWNRRKTR